MSGHKMVLAKAFVATRKALSLLLFMNFIACEFIVRDFAISNLKLDLVCDVFCGGIIVVE
ncbi:CLUMA_CG019776, isoform A [Clunio marinus]|uniref:CLUMA_CG019776, isoform A n=1 Tax=Clunio marinus TaxID=568069 RepID=A0A1J1J202_9DIPT|nr:CLUMA_CG019776, isoform A [Clunio marinus]